MLVLKQYNFTYLEVFGFFNSPTSIVCHYNRYIILRLLNI